MGPRLLYCGTRFQQADLVIQGKLRVGQGLFQDKVIVHPDIRQILFQYGNDFSGFIVSQEGIQFHLRLTNVDGALVQSDTVIQDTEFQLQVFITGHGSQFQSLSGNRPHTGVVIEIRMCKSFILFRFQKIKPRGYRIQGNLFHRLHIFPATFFVFFRLDEFIPFELVISK